MRIMKAEKRAYILLSLIQFLLGVYLLIKPEASFSCVCCITGGMLVVYGIIKLIGYFTEDMYNLAFQFDFAIGIILAVVGCLLLFRWQHIMELFPVYVGILILVDGMFKIQTALDARRFGLDKWWLILILAVAAGAAGVVLLIRPAEAAKLMMRLTGINLLIDGILNLWVVFYTVREWKNIETK